MMMMVMMMALMMMMTMMMMVEEEKQKDMHRKNLTTPSEGTGRLPSSPIVKETYGFPYVNSKVY